MMVNGSGLEFIKIGVCLVLLSHCFDSVPGLGQFIETDVIEFYLFGDCLVIKNSL